MSLLKTGTERGRVGPEYNQVGYLKLNMDAERNNSTVITRIPRKPRCSKERKLFTLLQYFTTKSTVLRALSQQIQKTLFRLKKLF